MALTDQQLAGPLFTMRLIVSALLVGLVTFAGIAVYLGVTGPAPRPPELPIITYMGFGMLAVCGVLSFALPGLLAPNIVQKSVLTHSGDPAHALVMAHQTLLIISCALCEGPGFLCLIAYIVERQWPALVGAGLAAALIALRFPTADGVRSFVARYTRG